MTSSLRPLDVILVRDAEQRAPATGDPSRALSPAGEAAARELAVELDGYEVTGIYCSPDASAVATIAPLAERRNLPVQLLDDLRERTLSPQPLEDGDATLEHAWTDADFAAPGGETGRVAQRRAVATLDLLRSRHPDGGRLVLGSHGNLISLMLHALEPGVDFAFQMAMPEPAVYRLTHDGMRWRVMGGHGFTPIE